jgi:hypothetical protein
MQVIRLWKLSSSHLPFQTKQGLPVLRERILRWETIVPCPKATSFRSAPEDGSDLYLHLKLTFRSSRMVGASRALIMAWQTATLQGTGLLFVNLTNTKEAHCLQMLIFAIQAMQFSMGKVPSVSFFLS